MKRSLQSIFEALPGERPGIGLKDSILKEIAFRVDRRRRWNIGVARFGVVTGGVVFGSSLWVYGPMVARSEFWNLLSLLFSDASTVLDSWQDYLFSLLETLPTVSLLVIVASTLALSFSVFLYSRVSAGRQRLTYA